MLRLHHSSLSRSVRILWLLEELAHPYELHAFDLADPAPKPFAQPSPFGKVPAIEDGEVTMFESGAILQYVLERYGKGRLAPAIDSALRGRFLQWIHFADSTAFVGLGNIAWHTRFRQDAERIPEAIADYRTWALAALDLLERELAESSFLLGHDDEDFSGADIMVGYSVLVAKGFGILDDNHPSVDAYLGRLTRRPALKKALSL